MKGRTQAITGRIHETPFWENGKFIVPEESQLYYATTWKWKWFYPIKIDAEQLAFVKDYEKKHGTITHWKDSEGGMRPILDFREIGKHGIRIPA